MIKSKRLFSVFLLLHVAAVHYGQDHNPYIDSIKAYIKYVDSIIMEHSIDSASGLAIAKSNVQFPNVADGGWCGEAQLYKSSMADSTYYRLSYSYGCNKMPRLQDFYFYKSKIVFIRTVDLSISHEKVDQYYRDDEIMNPGAEPLYITEGYQVLKLLSN